MTCWFQQDLALPILCLWYHWVGFTKPPTIIKQWKSQLRARLDFTKVPSWCAIMSLNRHQSDGLGYVCESMAGSGCLRLGIMKPFSWPACSVHQGPFWRPIGLESTLTWTGHQWEASEVHWLVPEAACPLGWPLPSLHFTRGPGRHTAQGADMLCPGTSYSFQIPAQNPGQTGGC